MIQGTKLMALFFVLTGLALAWPVGSLRADNCSISPVEARKLISQHGLISAGQASQIAAAQASGRAFHVKLCRSGGQFYYAVSVMKGAGGRTLTTVTVNARR